MINGLLIYNSFDYIKNELYADWLINEARKNDMNLYLIYSNEIYQSGVKNLSDIDFVINRSRDYNLSLMFELNGKKVFNDSTVTLYGNNKLSGYKLVDELNIKYSRILLDWKFSDKIISKPIYGHGGLGIEILQESINHILLENTLKQEVENVLGDVRFYVVNDEIVHSVIRKSTDGLLSNYSLGGTFEKYEASEYEKNLVKKIIDRVHFDYAGIDFLKLKTGEMLFNEIEDVVGSRMLSELGCNDTVPHFMEHIKNSLE